MQINEICATKLTLVNLRAVGGRCCEQVLRNVINVRIRHLADSFEECWNVGFGYQGNGASPPTCTRHPRTQRP